MTMITRNQIMDALMVKLKTMRSIKTFSRRFKEFSSTSMSAQMPYLMLLKPKEIYPARAISALPAKRTFHAMAIIYVSAGTDQSAIPDETVCDILDQLDIAIGKPPQTLGGLVDHCYIAGEILCVPGDIDGLGLINVPIEIVVP